MIWLFEAALLGQIALIARFRTFGAFGGGALVFGVFVAAFLRSHDPLGRVAGVAALAAAWITGQNLVLHRYLWRDVSVEGETPAWRWQRLAVALLNANVLLFLEFFVMYCGAMVYWQAS